MLALLSSAVIGSQTPGVGGGSAPQAGIHEAALKGDLDTVRALLAADPSLLDAEKPPNKKTPLHYAAQGGHADVVEFLLDKGAQVNRPNVIGETPLHYAATAESPAAATLLVASGADLGARTHQRGATPLTLATAFGRLATMKMLLERGADPRQAAPGGETLLHVAAVAGAVESIPLLVAAGADVNAAKTDGETPLLAACSAADLAKARALLKAGADPNRRDSIGRDPLALAAGTGQAELVTLLLEAGADARRPSAPGAVGALHSAAAMGYGRIVATLLARGADPRARDAKGRTALDLARAKGHARLAATLSEVTCHERDKAESNPARGTRSREQTGVLSNPSVEGGREAGAAAAGGSTPLNALLTRPLAPGESIVWYLGHLGWAVRTAKHFLIFDYDGRLTSPPDEPSLASGWIVPAEIRDLPTTVFITHDHDDHYAPAVFDWKGTVKDLTIVTGFEPEGKAGYVYIPPRESRTVGDLEITTIKAMDAGVGFHVRVDGISLFHSGDHDAAWEMPTFKPEIDFIADRGLRADLLFMPVQTGDIPILNDGLGYAIRRLSAGAFFPGHGRGREHVYLAVAKALRKAGVTTPIHCAEFGGDHFEARTSRQEPKRMSSMTEADWDASDRDRDGRYQLDAALESVGIAPGMTVGEVGAGAGYLVFKLAARVGPSGKVFAEDIKAYVLEILKTRARRVALALTARCSDVAPVMSAFGSIGIFRASSSVTISTEPPLMAVFIVAAFCEPSRKRTSPTLSATTLNRRADPTAAAWRRVTSALSGAVRNPAPLSSNRSIIARNPCWAAYSSGIVPRLSPALTSAPF